MFSSEYVIKQMILDTLNLFPDKYVIKQIHHCKNAFKPIIIERLRGQAISIIALHRAQVHIWNECDAEKQTDQGRGGLHRRWVSGQREGAHSFVFCAHRLNRPPMRRAHIPRLLGAPPFSRSCCRVHAASSSYVHAQSDWFGAIAVFVTDRGKCKERACLEWKKEEWKLFV